MRALRDAFWRLRHDPAFGLAGIRAAFWQAFWRRQAKYLPPAARVNIEGCSLWVDKDATVPGIKVEVGREWKNVDPR